MAHRAHRFHGMHITMRPGAAHKIGIKIFLQRIIQGKPARLGISRQALQTLFAHRARRHIDGAAEGDVVPGSDHAQVTDQVLYFPAAVEFYAAEHAVRQAVLDEALLQRPAEIMGTVQHGHIAKVRAGIAQLAQLSGNPGRLGLFAPGVKIQRLGA